MVLSEQFWEAKAASDTDIMAAVSKLVEALAKEKGAAIPMYISTRRCLAASPALLERRTRQLDR
jgi:hypothetical protein